LSSGTHTKHSGEQGNQQDLEAKLKATMNGPLVFWGKVLSKEFQKLIIDRDIIEAAHGRQ
jgi:hypothetical protein